MPLLRAQTEAHQAPEAQADRDTSVADGGAEVTAREFKAQFGAKGDRRGGNQSERHDALVSACVLYLNTRSVGKRRVRAIATATGRFTGKRCWGTAGTPDVLFWLPAKPWDRPGACEVKTGTGKVTTGQSDFLRATLEGGGVVFIIHDDVTDLKRQWEGFQENRAW
jgi:hypothetical protein